MFANLKKAQDLKQMLSRFTSYYVKHPLGELGIGTTSLDEGDRFEEDLAAIPDLAAGAVSELLTKLCASYGGIIHPSIVIPFSGTFSPKTELLISWLGDRSQRLKKVVILFEKQGNGSFSVSRLNMP